MKRIILLIVLCIGGKFVRAQSDIQAMLKQIALLGLYVEDLEKGIEIAREGLTTISEIKNGEFNLHNLFFNSLRQVNPAVAKYSKIAEMIADQISITEKFKSLISKVSGPGGLSGSEINYINRVWSNLSNECTQSLNDLVNVLSEGHFEMTDDERIQRIDGIYDDLKDKKAFTMSFTDRTEKLLNGRKKIAGESQVLKSLE